MEMKMLILIRKTVLLCLSFLVFLGPFRGMSQYKIDFENCVGTFLLPIEDMDSSLDVSIGVKKNLEADPDYVISSVFWALGPPPSGATSTDGFHTNFTKNGITVTLPAGESDDAISADSELTIIGTPEAATSFSFTMTVTDENNPTLTCTQVYEFIFSPSSMDLVLVLDRSGSMNANTTSTPPQSRWTALKNSVRNFMTVYKELDRPSDRLSITYFATDVALESPEFSEFVPHNSLSSIINMSTSLDDVEFDLMPGPNGLTAMGMGLQNAETKLMDEINNSTKRILLFTDGQQNRTPWVHENGQAYYHYEGEEQVFTPIQPGVKIFTIGIGGPGTMNETLNKLADESGGNYISTQDGDQFSDADGADLPAGFINQFVALLAESSPQLVARSYTSIAAGSAPVVLQSFPLNKRVDKLLLEFVFDQNLDSFQLVQMMEHIQVLKDGVPVNQYARRSWVGDYTNTLLITIDFDARLSTRGGSSSLTSDGDWSVQLADVSNLRVNRCNLTVIADDHRLHIKGSYGDVAPKVNDVLPLSLTLDWLSHPIEDATVEVLILRPGEDLGDLLARNPLVVELAKDDEDARNPGTQKFEHLWATDSAFREQLKKTENLVTLSHAENGNYEGSFSGLNVSGVYHLIFRVSGNHPDAGQYQRILSRSFYASFSNVDLGQSGVSSQIVRGQLIMQIKPMTSYGMFVGPAMGDAFSVGNPNIQISDVVDHQDGSYTITFTGDIDATTTLQLLGQDIYTGRLENAGKSASIIDRIQDWLVSIGLPAWSIWILLLLIILILWLIFKKKK